MCHHFTRNEQNLGHVCCFWGKNQNIVSPSVLPEGNQERWQHIILILNNKIKNKTNKDKLKYPVTLQDGTRSNGVDEGSSMWNFVQVVVKQLY
jgi:hypothetical protein